MIIGEIVWDLSVGDGQENLCSWPGNSNWHIFEWAGNWVREGSWGIMGW